MEIKSYVTIKEYLKDANISDLSIEYQHNMEDLLKAVNTLLTKYGKDVTVSSGFRTMQDHLRIYSQKGITDPKKIPMKSKHLSAQAIDLYDPKQELQKWIKENVKTLEELGIYCEDFAYTKNWVHCQIVPPKSGNRFFIP